MLCRPRSRRAVVPPSQPGREPPAQPRYGRGRARCGRNRGGDQLPAHSAPGDHSRADLAVCGAAADLDRRHRSSGLAGHAARGPGRAQHTGSAAVRVLVSVLLGFRCQRVSRPTAPYCRLAVACLRQEPFVTGMFIWPQIDDQRQRSLVTAGAQIQTTNTSEAVYVLAAVSAWPGVATRRFRGPSRSVTGVLAHRAAGSAPNDAPMSVNGSDDV